MIDTEPQTDIERLRNVEEAEDAKRHARWNPLHIVLSALLFAWACLDILTHPTIESCLEMLLPVGSLLLVISTVQRGRLRTDEWVTHPSLLVALSGAVMVAGSLTLPNLHHFHRDAFVVVGSFMLAAVVILTGFCARGYVRLRREVAPSVTDD